MKQDAKRSKFSGSIGFVLAAASSAVGLGNIWRFPYLAAKDGGGLFIIIYIILAVTFGFAILASEIAIGRKTAQGPLNAYGKINSKFKKLGVLAWIVPFLIIPYYCVVGGWVLKYLATFITGGGNVAATEGYFTSFTANLASPIIWLIVSLVLTSAVGYLGVNKGIEKCSKFIMPILIILIVTISIFSLTLRFTDESGVSRTALEGLKFYLIPNLDGITFKQLLITTMDAMGQLFFSISVAAGMMVTYGSYASKEDNLVSSINQIEIYDTLVALLAGLMIIPAVYTFMGVEGMSAGPSLLFVSMPKIFNAMGNIGGIIGTLFFLAAAFAAITSSVSVIEAIVAGIIDKWHLSRGRAVTIATVYTLVMGVIVCLGYNKLYFKVTLPNGTVGQILDVLDYLSNSIFMPIVAFLTCILIGWVAKPQIIIDELTRNCNKFRRKTLYIVMIKFVAPIMLFLLFIQSFITK